MPAAKIRMIFATSVFMISCFSALTSSAHARGYHGRHGSLRHQTRTHSKFRHHSGGHVIQCVAFAKNASEVSLHGNAADWWHNAAGIYDRGNAPEQGSVLNFRSTRRMPLGHVAVVTEVINSRTIIIDQSHWGQRGISRNTPVIDVSPNNDWSAVRVAVGHSDTYGSIYPTYGFIYPRAPGANQNRIITASNSYKLRNHSHVVTASANNLLSHPMVSTEVAEAPAGTLSSALPYDAPNRNLR